MLCRKHRQQEYKAARAKTVERGGEHEQEYGPMLNEEKPKSNHKILKDVWFIDRSHRASAFPADGSA